MKKRLLFLFILGILIILGIGSRMVRCIPVETGDVIWAMALYCFLRILFPKKSNLSITLASLFISFLDEFSQLLKFEWLVSIRATWLGHMILGQGFEWQDLVAYTLGVVLMYTSCRIARLD